MRFNKKLFLIFIVFLLPLLIYLIYFFTSNIGYYTAKLSEFNNTSWYRSTGNDQSNRFTSLNQITKDNIGNLTEAWSFNSGIDGVSQTTPIFTGKFLISASANFLYALHPTNGNEIWRTKFDTEIAKRGLVFYRDLIFIPSSAGIYSVNAETGEIINRYGEDTSFIAPVFHDNSVITANYTSVKSYDLDTAQLNWAMNLQKDKISARIWSGMTYDSDTGYIFIVTSNTGHIADMKFKDGGYANSLIAINANSGKVVWQVREIKHDLWDLDAVGHPILTDVKVGKKVIPSVVAVTKSGNTLFVNKNNGDLIFGSKKINIPKYHDQAKYASKNQILIEKPEPFSSNYFDIESDLTNLSEEKKEYVKFKLRNAKSDLFRPVSTDQDVVLYGLHGGAEWHGAALSPNKHTLVIPSNKYPWILRAYPYAQDEEKIINMAKINQSYMNKCASCHGNDLRGGFLWESYSDLYFPPLVDAAKKINNKDFISLENFLRNHKYIDQIKKTKLLMPYSNGLDRIFEMVNNNKEENIDYTNLDYKALINSVSKSDLESIYKFLEDVKSQFIDKEKYEIKSFWQLLLDQDGLPGSKPPYGYLSSIDLATGKLKWKKPFGIIKKNDLDIKGDMNHGGIMITGSDIIFAGGTRDSMVRAFDLESGNELWNSLVPAASSAPPMSYYANGCQYVVFTVTGGIFVGYDKKSDSTIAYKLKSCQ